MGLPSLTLLDVGHGLCAILRTATRTLVVDAGPGSTLLEYLDSEGIAVIDLLMISHADADHIAGAVELLSQTGVTVVRVMVNPDEKGSAVWKNFRVAARDARLNRGTEVVPSLATDCSPVLDDQVRVEVLAPAPEVALGGVGGTDLAGQTITSNGLSAVVRIVVDDTPLILLTGDIDVTGLTNLLAEEPDPRASVLVFPHHGGSPGGNATAFALQICEAVQPDHVVFSVGRGRYRMPRPDIVAAVRAARPDAWIACTQLSEWCATAVPAVEPGHLGPAAAAGKVDRHCCLGTFVFDLGGGSLDVHPARAAHLQFIEENAPTALCLGRGALTVDQVTS